MYTYDNFSILNWTIPILNWTTPILNWTIPFLNWNIPILNWTTPILNWKRYRTSVLDMILNCIWWWGSSFEVCEIPFIIITWSIDLIFIVIITTFRSICPTAFFRLFMSNSEVLTGSWTEPFLWNTGVGWFC